VEAALFVGSSEALAVVYGLASAASWGAGDFSGGFASKRSNVYSVIIVSQLVGALFLIGLAFALAESIPSLDNLILGGMAGISGAIGLMALYTGLARGRMGIVAPITAVVAAFFPVIVGILNEGLPSPQRLVGFGIALIAIWFLSRAGKGAVIRLSELALPTVAGLGFGLFYIFIDRVSHAALLWPLVAARIASIGMLSILIAVRRQREVPAANQLLIIALAGTLDAGGNAFFALATQVGRLDISAVLASLYPATTVLLAWLILKERLVRQQWLGVTTALIALVLIAS
jgi:drug/metabolite transporter (DMT)-like permease